MPSDGCSCAIAGKDWRRMAISGASATSIKSLTVNREALELLGPSDSGTQRGGKLFLKDLFHIMKSKNGLTLKQRLDLVLSAVRQVRLKSLGVLVF